MRRSLFAFSGIVSIAASVSSGDDKTRVKVVETAPPPSAGHALVYDEDLQLVLLVNAGLGGEHGPYRVDDATKLWGFDGKGWQLVDEKGPPVRNLGGVAYDVERKRLVLHGGSYDLEHTYADTWEWEAKAKTSSKVTNGSDGPSGTWKKFDGKGPGVRDHSRMAYDPDRKLTVLFGGQIDLEHFPRDVWTFDGRQWRREEPAGGPGPRVHHAMAFDPDLHGIVVAGGYEPGVADHADAWLLDGKGWHVLPNLPAARTHACMEFDPGSGLVLVGSGDGAAPVMTFAKSGWSAIDAPAGLAKRLLTALAFDVDRDVMVLFGGGNPSGSDLFADTWENDGKGWRRIDAKH